MMNVSQMEDMISRFEDRREIKNLMGKYFSALAVRMDSQLWDLFWSQKQADVCLGVNTGFYSGKDAICGFYRAREDKVRKASKVMQEIFPKELGELSDEELYGVGMFEQKPVQNAYVVVAGDRKTAKGLWAINGSFTDITEVGPSVSWIWAFAAVDFVYEDGQWKLWHMQYLEDVNVRCGQNWVGEAETLPELPEFAALKGVTLPEPNVKQTLWTPYNEDRPFAGTPRMPEPYETFAETFSYGV